ncbi:MAG: ribonuclease [Actinomycetota bacterium]|jgi:ribonuclease HII|nr:ribonuclease [Actinomycetota bacterium]
MEARLASAGFSKVAGADEVGRGALAGPLIAAAVILPSGCEIEGLRDSKMCTRLQRERLAERIREVALGLAIVRVHHSRIDRVGLQRSNLDALRRAVKGLETEPDFVIFDCFRIKRLPYPSLGVKKGDAVSKNVAAASIVAKVHRDAVMRRYHRRHPQYGFATNVGYGTREHWQALIAHGPSPVHRLSFFGVVGFPDEQGVVKPHKARDLTEAPGPPNDREEECV